MKITNTTRIISKFLRSACLPLAAISLLPNASSATPNYLDWADVGASNESWYASSWYDVFYHADSYNEWIWHAQHGWQYVPLVSTADATYIWDDETHTWFYTTQTWYPMMYSWSKEKWYYFMADSGYKIGSYTARAFWDYSTDSKKPYQLVGGLGSETYPFTNEDIAFVGASIGDSYYVMDNFSLSGISAGTASLDVGIGRTTSNNIFEIKNGAVNSFASVGLGFLATSNDNSLTITGASTTVKVTGDINVGISGTGNSLTLLNGSILIVDGSVYVPSSNTIYLGAGFLAIKGDATATLTALLSAGRINVHTNSYTWTTANTSNTHVSVFTDDAAGDTAALALTGYSDLGGYTVISSTSEAPSLVWAGSTTQTGWWYNSAWYGSFYTNAEYDGVIWHSIHGWQTISDTSTATAVYLWDNGTNSNWYIDPAQYEDNMYNYATTRFYKYVSGVYPNRVFYDWTALANVNEADINPAP